jgi:hypothetical protein
MVYIYIYTTISIYYIGDEIGTHHVTFFCFLLLLCEPTKTMMMCHRAVFERQQSGFFICH